MARCDLGAVLVELEEREGAIRELERAVALAEGRYARVVQEASAELRRLRQG